MAAREPLSFWSGSAFDEEFAEVVQDWPLNYPPLPTAIPAHHTPVLMLNGGLDIQTPRPRARQLARDIDAQLVEFPYAGHGVNLSLASPYTQQLRLRFRSLRSSLALTFRGRR